MNDRPQLDLFSEVGVPNSAHSETPRIFARCCECGRRASLFLAVNNRLPPRLSRYAPKQLSLDLQCLDNVVIRLVPRTRSTFLGMRTTSFFRRSPALRRFAFRYRDRGVIFLGDLLRLPPHEVLNALRRPEWIWELQGELAGAGLALGDRFTWWKRPSPY
ncbi:MAG: hypothetical protein JWL65_3773 [Gammaproteobacteria bacterium]|nr:hypothetical protein [Gammaproteobacteria bacterium]